MESQNKQLVNNTVVLGIGQLVPKILAIVILPILTKHLNTEEYGIYDLILCVADLLIPIITIQIQQATFRYLLSTTDKDEKSEYITASVNYVFISSLLIIPIIYYLLRWRDIEILVAIIICLYFIFQSFYNLLGQIVRGVGNNIKYTIGVILYSFIHFICIFIFIIICNKGFIGVILSLVIAFFCSCIYMILSNDICFYYHPFHINKKVLKKLILFALPIVPSSIALWVVNLSDRLIIIKYLGQQANGVYAVSNKIPVIYNTAYNIFNLAWTETASQVSENSNAEKYYSDLFNLLFHFLIGGMFLLISITPYIFKLLVNQQYADSIYQVPILYFGVFFNSFVNFFSAIYIALKKTNKVGVSSAIGAILNFLINIIFIKHIGLYASSISTAVSFCVIAIYRAYDLRKYINIQYNYKEIGVGFLLFIILTILFYLNNYYFSIFSLVCALLYNFLYNRFILVSIIRRIIMIIKCK